MNMRKKLLLVAVMLTVLWGKSFACGWDEGDWYYYNLFNQEIMSDERYRPFLLIYGSRYYSNDTLRNGNIEEWRQYLGLSYDDTQYLVFKSTRSDLQNLTKGKEAIDTNLSFATPEFVKKHKQALLYLAYAKYLEPYMRIIPSDDNDGFYWDLPEYEHNAGDLDYDKVKTVLTKSWNAESDKELKLRYGYQLVRLAHYTRRYNEAVQLFDQYVKPLNMNTEMYYYALSQKAGALRGLGETQKANREFIRVFANSYDLKTLAYSSLTMGWDNDISFADFVAGADDDNERNDIYFMMGYSDFNNPVNEIEKIVVTDPDAIQAKVLMVRAVNMLERRMLSSEPNWEQDGKNLRYPCLSPTDTDGREFFNQALRISDTQRDKTSDKNFWNLASSYLHFLNHDYDQASTYLANVKSNDNLYMDIVNHLTVFIDICHQPEITASVERNIFEKYGDLIRGSSNYAYNEADNSFISLVLANRYDLQGEAAKSFMVLHTLNAVEDAPNDKLLNDIQSFLNKKKKTPLEEYIVSTRTDNVTDANKYIDYVKGVLRLTDGDFKDAKKLFEKRTRLMESKLIFGHNIRVWYYGEESDIMLDDYISEFPFLRDNMTELEVTEALMQLQKIGEGQGDEAAKANYLIANFYYNVSRTGYYRHYLRFDNDNAFCYRKYSIDADSYKNTLALSDNYLEKAKKIATDRELLAHIVFAQAKNAQEDMEVTVASRWDYTMVVPDEQFDELDQYEGTDYYDAVRTNCLYFSDYHN